MPASYSRFARMLMLVLVPTLAVAGPHKKKKVDKPAEKKDDAASKDADASKDAPKDAPKDAKDAAHAGSEAKDAPKDAKDAAKPDDKPQGLLSTGTVGGGGGGAGSGSGSGSASDTKPPKEDQPPANEPDVDALRQEYLSLKDELFKSRARAAAVASQLYSTRITIRFTWGSARYYGVSKASVRLDGATVYEGTDIATDDGVRFDGYVAPGRHLVTFHVEASGKDDDSFTSATESQVVVKAVASKDLVVAAKGHDSGDIAYAWKKSERGSYGLGIDVSVKTAKPAAGGEAPAKGKK
jgi:hypothetical protein